MKRRIILAALALTLASGSAWAIVIGGSNFSVMGYPDHRCYKPSRPYGPIDQWAADRYNSYMRIYRDCVIDYLDNAENDIKRIKEKMQGAVDEASS